MYSNNRTSKELWAAVNSAGEILWNRGGSSTGSKPLVYDSEKKLAAALKNYWIKQEHGDKEIQMRKIYEASI